MPTKSPQTIHTDRLRIAGPWAAWCVGIGIISSGVWHAAGAKAGAGAGVAVGLAAVPVLGPGVAVLLLVGSTLRGAEIGGLVHALRSGVQLAYPATIVVRVHRAAP